MIWVFLTEDRLIQFCVDLVIGDVTLVYTVRGHSGMVHLPADTHVKLSGSPLASATPAPSRHMHYYNSDCRLFWGPVPSALLYLTVLVPGDYGGHIAGLGADPKHLRSYDEGGIIHGRWDMSRTVANGPARGDCSSSVEPTCHPAVFSR